MALAIVRSVAICATALFCVVALTSARRVRSSGQRGIRGGRRLSVTSSGEIIMMLQGSCRTEGDRHGTFTSLACSGGDGKCAEDECEEECLGSESCVAFEFTAESGKCELHSESIDHATGAAGVSCYRVAHVRDLSVDDVLGGLQDAVADYFCATC